MSQDRGFAAVAVVVQQLLVRLDVLGRHQDQVRRPVDRVESGLTVSCFTVVDQSPQTAAFFCSIHTEEKMNALSDTDQRNTEMEGS